MAELFLHLGYPKTGSSLIQRELLRHSPEVNMINIKWEKKYVIDDFLAGIDHANCLKDFVTPRIEKNKKNILSCEDFSGEFTTNLNYFRILTELAILFPEAKPVVCLRDHYSYLESMYKHCVRRGFCGNRLAFYKIYERDKKEGFVFYQTATLLQKLKFFDYINNVKKLFGDVRIINFHKLTNIDLVTTEIYNAFEISLPQNEINFVITNEGHNDISVIFQRILNRFVRSVYNSGGVIHPTYTKYLFHGTKLISPGFKIANREMWKKILAEDNVIITNDKQNLLDNFDFIFDCFPLS